MNLYNQIGIVAVNILGSPIDAFEYESTKDVDIADAITRGIIERSFADENTPIDSDLNYIDHDKYIVHVLAGISTMKKDAVRQENYPIAKALKQLQESASTISNAVSSLLAEKRNALLAEDYDKAQAIQVIGLIITKKLILDCKYRKESKRKRKTCRKG